MCLLEMLCTEKSNHHVIMFNNSAIAGHLALVI